MATTQATQAVGDVAIVGGALAKGPAGVATVFAAQTLQLIKDLGTPANYHPSQLRARKNIETWAKDTSKPPTGFVRDDIVQLVQLSAAGAKAYQPILDAYDRATGKQVTTIWGGGTTDAVGVYHPAVTSVANTVLAPTAAIEGNSTQAKTMQSNEDITTLSLLFIGVAAVIYLIVKGK